MRNNFFNFIVFVFVLTSVTAQNTISDYSFVLVPKQFDFQKSEDQYQLNSIAKFLFNKHGFNAFFNDEMPNVKRCDGLYAEVVGKPNFIWTTVYVVLKDCNGQEIFRTAEGKSKLKEYSKTYNQALRNAFVSFEELDIQQKEIVVAENREEAPVTKETSPKVEKESIPASDDKKNNLNLPQSPYTQYTLQNTNYMLRKTTEGFSLYKETTDALDDGLFLQGKVIIEERNVFYQDTNNARYPAGFDTQGNLWVQMDDAKKILYTKV